MNEKKPSFAIPLGGIAVIVFCCVWSLVKDKLAVTDFEPFAQWWIVLLGIGIGFYPLAALLFRKFSDKGYFFGKVLGIVISGWLV